MLFSDFIFNVIPDTFERTRFRKGRLSFSYSKPWKGNIKFFIMFLGKGEGNIEKRSWENKNEAER